MAHSKRGLEVIQRLKKLTDELEENQVLSVRHKAKRITLNLQPQPYDPQKIRETREIIKVSQSLFADFIGVSVSTVQKWETGQREPDRMACRLLDEISGDPDYWIKRFRESAEIVQT